MANTDDSTLQEDWRHQVEISPSYEEYRPRIMVIMKEFQTISDSQRGTIIENRRIIALTLPDTRSILSVPYGPGTATQTFQKTKIDIILEMGIIEPDQT